VTLHRLAELGDRCGDLGRERRGGQAAGDAVGLGQPLEAELALAGGGRGDAGPQQDLRAFEGDVEAVVELDRALELLGGERGVALGQRRLAQRVGERREGVRMAGGGGDGRQRLGACSAAPSRASQTAAQRSPQTA
jgi:hypothetical protein